MNWTTEEVISQMKDLGSENDRQGMGRFGISVDKAFGVRMPVIRSLAKEIKTNHQLAQELWETGYHEIRILAALLLDPKQLEVKLMENWIRDFDSWDVCDQCCMGPFRKHPEAFKLAVKWSRRKPEFERRAGFALMASLAVHAKNADNIDFDPFFRCIREQSTDSRNFVKKAVNWALRQIGKRNRELGLKAIEVANEINKQDSRAAQWIAKDAIKELTPRV